MTPLEPDGCPEHGHPAHLPTHLAVWVDFFVLIAPYCTPTTLDHGLISKICDEYGIKFSDAFYWLSFIHREVAKRDELTESNSADEGQKKGVQPGRKTV